MVTVIYVTSQGWISTYFFPEPILFYGMAVTASMLPFIAISYALVSLFGRAVRAAGSLYRAAFSPMVEAKNIVILMLLVMFTLCVILIWSLTAVTGWCLPTG